MDVFTMLRIDDRRIKRRKYHVFLNTDLIGGHWGPLGINGDHWGSDPRRPTQTHADPRRPTQTHGKDQDPLDLAHSR